ncbi:unnamed protein product [Rotaria magnacalcarata]|uniref:Uncharacterized protein n=1 Tax=Rotaria magnacalcarata TaxID=392030 RepID=A0A8S2QGY1_9BILA|nr:unnamed protein product [Rotaria magnacalcarata]CAF4458465.1 unnamed protein product [Rotaria magnacalcarata]
MLATIGSVVNQQNPPTAALRILANGLSSTRLALYIDTLEPEYNPQPAPQLIYHKECNILIIIVFYLILSFFSICSNGTTTTTHKKTSYASSGASNTGAVRSICRPTAQTNSSSSKVVSSSSPPVPSPAPIVEQQIQPQLQIPNNHLQ